ncbi:MAG: hypothetical protein ACK4PI_13955 [Tepidisphaerales bacterium]
MPVKRNAGKDVTPKPLLLDRARKARPVPVKRAPLYKRAAKPTLALAVFFGVGGVLAYRGLAHVDTTRLLNAAPALRYILPANPDRPDDTPTDSSTRPMLPEPPPQPRSHAEPAAPPPAADFPGLPPRRPLTPPDRLLSAERNPLPTPLLTPHPVSPLPPDTPPHH